VWTKVLLTLRQVPSIRASEKKLMNFAKLRPVVLNCGRYHREQVQRDDRFVPVTASALERNRRAI